MTTMNTVFQNIHVINVSHCLQSESKDYAFVPWDLKSAFGLFVTAQCSGNNRSDSLKGDKKSYIEMLI